MINNDVSKKIKSDIKKALPILICVALGITLISQLLGTVCYIKLFFGIPCPACGITRAFKLLLQFKFLDAFYMHPMISPVALWFIIFVITRYFLPNNKILKVYSIICVLLFISLYIYRMIYMYPDVEPMEYFSKNILNFTKNLLK